MEKDDNIDILNVDSIYCKDTERQLAEFNPILRDFTESYAQNPNLDSREFLRVKMSEYLPEKSKEEIDSYVKEIVTSLKVTEEKKIALKIAIKEGRTPEGWFASELDKATSALTVQDKMSYFNNLDSALEKANEKMAETITTNAGAISQNPSLDGYIAEQYHAQTFNLNAQEKGSQYRAEVLNSNGKNSVDIVIKDSSGKIVKRYQSKYCQDPQSTQQAFDNGDYRGQRKLVPADQKGEINAKATDVITAPDGVSSNPMTKIRAKEMQQEAQSGNWKDMNWDEYKTKDLAVGIGRQSLKAGVQGAAFSTVFNIGTKLIKGEEIKGKEVLETALKSGADAGAKAAVAGALKVGAEKGILKFIPKGTPASTLANVAFVAVEDAKILYKMAKGEVSVKEGVDAIGRTTVSATAGLVTMSKGAAIGSAIGTFAGPIGTAIGGFIGGAVGYMVGSKFGEAVYEGAKTAAKAVGKVAKKIGSAIKQGWKSLCSLFS